MTDGTTITVGLVTDPGLPSRVCDKLARTLPGALTGELGGDVSWEVEATCEPLLLDAEGAIPVFAIADQYRTRHGWDMVVLVTDLPRRVGVRPIVGDFSTAHRAALASLPALGGGFRLGARLRDLLVHMIGHLAAERLGISPDPGFERSWPGRHIPGGPPPRHLGEILAPTRHIGSAYPDVDAHLALTGLRGRLRLLRGMVYNNRPWRLLPHLASATAAAAATAAFGIFYWTIWTMAEALPVWRLALINVLTIAVMVGWLIYYNNLWERPVGPGRAHQAILYNASTVLTLLVSVACMYATLYAGTLIAASTVIDATYLSSKVGHPVGPGDYATLVWLACSMGIVAGALGSSLDGEEAVRQATYSRREQERQARRRAQEEAAGNP
ncbi:MAG: hypothetical protein FWE35_06920 [Streptosporangiales bacterium]|nr:hypothetical protein [Streptosporangiales bacterium]